MFDFSRIHTEFFHPWMEQFRSGSGTGEYSYRRGGPTSLYGTTDMVFSRYILNNFKLTDSEKDSWAGTINQFQDPLTGWYHKTYTHHYKEHTTAYAIAALHLLHRLPKYPLKFLEHILPTPQTWEKWVNHISWSLIWPGSHVISGVPACMIMTSYPKFSDHPFYAWYFDWLEREVDPKTGFWCRGLVHKLKILPRPTKHELGGAFHMYYIYEYFRRQWLHPERIVDECLRLQHSNGLWDKDITYCIDLDGIYSMIRSSKMASNYRAEEVKQAVIRYLTTAYNTLTNRDFFFSHYINSHILPGALAAIAECQKHYPDLITAPKLEQSLDYACFI